MLCILGSTSYMVIFSPLPTALFAFFGCFVARRGGGGVSSQHSPFPSSITQPHFCFSPLLPLRCLPSIASHALRSRSPVTPSWDWMGWWMGVAVYDTIPSMEPSDGYRFFFFFVVLPFQTCKAFAWEKNNPRLCRVLSLICVEDCKCGRWHA